MELENSNRIGILTNKHADRLPLYRQENILKKVPDTVWEGSYGKNIVKILAKFDVNGLLRDNPFHKSLVVGKTECNVRDAYGDISWQERLVKLGAEDDMIP